LVAAFVIAIGSPATAEVCGDADGNGEITVTDGVAVLRSAADLPSNCLPTSCDVDGNGTISVTDGVAVLRAAAELSADLSCVSDPFISSVQGEDGTFGPLRKLPGGLTSPQGAPQTVTKVEFGEAFVAGRVNTVTVEYDLGVQAQAAAEPSLLVASEGNAPGSNSAVFDLPLPTEKGSVSIALDLKPDVPVQQFTLKLANGSDTKVAGQVFSVVIVVIRNSNPECGNRVLDQGETCDPPGFGCPAATGAGFCNSSCTCETLTRFVNNGDGTITDTQHRLQWEEKSGVVGTPVDCSTTSCPDPHDVNNLYQWCADLNHDSTCDTGGNPPDGGAFVSFLAALNTPPCFAGHCDWRLPTVNREHETAELETIVDPTAPACGGGSPCIDPIFGPTADEFYWASTATPPTDQFPDYAWEVRFADGFVNFDHRYSRKYVRAVRSAP
jgi:hypothetical protein